jgi:hypothetical protein
MAGALQDPGASGTGVRGTSHDGRPGASPASTFPGVVGPPGQLDEMQARCVRIYGLLRAGLITPFECDVAIGEIEKHYGVR